MMGRRTTLSSETVRAGEKVALREAVDVSGVLGGAGGGAD